MNLENFKNKFDINFYRWSAKEFEEEINNGFEILKTVQNVHVMKFLEMMKALTVEEKIKFSKALLKNRHGNGARLCEDILTAEES